MAFFDWDGNGKKDIADDFIEYQIYEECTKDEDTPSNHDASQSTSDTSGCSCMLSVLGILFLIKIIAELFS